MFTQKFSVLEHVAKSKKEVASYFEVSSHKVLLLLPKQL